MMIALLILPGKVEEWRRFIQELAGSRRPDYEAWLAHLKISQVQVWLYPHPFRDTVLVSLEVENALPPSAAGNLPVGFAKWFNSQVMALHGYDLTRWKSGGEPVLDWQAPD